MTRILIADDHAVVREGLKQLLAEDFPHAEFCGSTTIAGTLAAIQKGPWDLLVLDLFMPDGNGFGILQEVRDNYPRLPVLVLSSASEEQLGLRVLRAGASGYVSKQTAPERLVQAVRKALGGGKYVSGALAEQLAAKACRGDQPLYETLSDREFQILHLVVEGRALKEIAAVLSLSVKTVRTFHTRVLGKLHLRSDVDLVHYALDHGLVEKRVSPRSH
ncbi:MAG TPA: response regulator transcription factor [Candidatus Baltobacteraceae bacterium]|nr:response regulator transcription factor [Candidatus Baltobacteraceae bacterium]